MGTELEGKVAVVTGAASGIGLASAEAMLAAGSRVVMVDRDEAALKALRHKFGDAVIPLVIDLLDPKDCASLLPRVLEKAGQLDILHHCCPAKSRINSIGYLLAKYKVCFR